MKCSLCHRKIAPGQQWDTRMEGWLHPDGSEHAYGTGLETGPCGSAPAGSALTWAKHRKALPVSELVLTPHGFVPAGKLVTGDVVVAGDGSSCLIRARFDYERPTDIFTVRLEDGAECRADLGHLWMTGRGLLETKELAPKDQLPDSPSYDGWESPAGDPYVLGALLGDGFLPMMFVTTADSEIRDELVRRADGVVNPRFTSAGTQVWDVKVRSQESFVLSLGLAGAIKRDKFLPDSVWAWSAADRLSLLRGLMDTDGFVARLAGQSGFTVASFNLAKGVQRLAWSLGGTARINTVRHADNKYGPYFGVSVRTPECPFWLERKRVAWEALPGTRRPRMDLRRRVVREVVPTGYQEQVICFDVGHSSGLFVAGDFVVTHNCYYVAERRVQRGHDAVLGSDLAQAALAEDEDD